jgi:hypothetical protein
VSIQTCVVEGVVEKWAIAGAREVEGVIEKWAGGVVDVEGAREVEGVIKRWAVAGAHEVEGVIDVWQGMNELFNLVGCRPCNSFSTNIAS